MRLLKKIMSAFATAAFAIVVTACANPIGVKAGAVNIKEITAQKYEMKKEVAPVEAKYAAALMMQKANVAIAHAEGDGANYVLIYKDEHNIKLTVTLDNPKGESIDALEISCDDPDAKILVDGEYKPMNVTANGRVVNWAQEDPYQKTFYMQTVADSAMNTIRVNDVKVNGAWQQGTLTNNELSIYKITKDNFDVKFVANTTEYYEVEFVTGQNVSNLIVNCDHGQQIDASRYRVTANCELNWTFEYTFGTTVRTWTESRDIELFNYTIHQVVKDGDPIFGTAGDTTSIRISKINGTGIETRYLNVMHNGVTYQLNKAEYNIYVISSDQLVYNHDNRESYIIIIGNSRYLVNEANTDIVALA